MYGGNYGHNPSAPKSFGVYGSQYQPNTTPAGVFGNQYSQYSQQHQPRGFPPPIPSYGAPNVPLRGSFAARPPPGPRAWVPYSQPPPGTYPTGPGQHLPNTSSASSFSGTAQPQSHPPAQGGVDLVRDLLGTQSASQNAEKSALPIGGPSSTQSKASATEEPDLGDLLAQLANYSDHYNASKTEGNTLSVTDQGSNAQQTSEDHRSLNASSRADGQIPDATRETGNEFAFPKEASGGDNQFDVTWPAQENESSPETGIQSPDLPANPIDSQNQKLKEMLQSFKFDETATQMLKETVMSRLMGQKPQNPAQPSNVEAKVKKAVPKDDDMLTKLRRFLRPDSAAEDSKIPQTDRSVMGMHQDSSFLPSPFTGQPLLQPSREAVEKLLKVLDSTKPPAPGVDPASVGSQKSSIDPEWDKRTRDFEKSLQEKKGTHKRSRSVESSSSSSSEEESSDSGKQKKKRSRGESKKSKRKREEKKREKESHKSDRKKNKRESGKVEAPRSIDEDIEIMMTQVEELKLRKFEMQKRETLLANEMSRMKKQHGELCRKMQRQKDGHKDPLLTENLRLQKEIQKQLDHIRLNVSEMDKTLKDTEPRLSALRNRRKAKEASKKTPKKETGEKEKEREKEKVEKKSTSSAQKIHYEYFDGGSHFCSSCATTSASLYDYFQHLHSPPHKKNLENKKDSSPWVPEHVKDPTKALKPPSNAKVVVNKIKGVEFLLPCVGFYCKLCHEFSGDPVCGEDHLKCEKHSLKYQKYLEDHPEHERSLKQEMSASMQKKTEEVALLSVSSVSDSSDVRSPAGLSKFEPDRHVSSTGSHIKVKVPSDHRHSPKREHPESRKMNLFANREHKMQSRVSDASDNRGDGNQRPYKKQVTGRWQQTSRPSGSSNTPSLSLSIQREKSARYPVRKPTNPPPRSRWSDPVSGQQQKREPVPELKPDAVNLAKAVKNRLEGKASAAELAMLSKYKQKEVEDRAVSTSKTAQSKAGRFVPTTVSRGFVPVPSISVGRKSGAETTVTHSDRGRKYNQREEIANKGPVRESRRQSDTRDGEEDELEVLAALTTEVVQDINKLKKSGGNSEKALFGVEKLPGITRSRER